MNDRFLKRPLSYSQLSSWEYDPEQWYESYILGKRTPPNATMEAGTKIGDLIGTDQCPLKTAQGKPHYVQPSGVKEFELRARLGDIHIVGFADHFDPQAKTLHENKTSVNKSRWSQPKVNAHGQLTMYALMLFLTHDIKPDEVQMYLNFIPTVKRLVLKPEYHDVPTWALDEHICDELVELPDPVVWKQYPTTRTASDIAEYVEYIHETVKAMHEYVDNRVETTG